MYESYVFYRWDRLDASYVDKSINVLFVHHYVFNYRVNTWKNKHYKD